MTTCVEIENDIIKNNLTTSDWISNKYFYDTFEYVKNSGLWLEFGVATGSTINIISSKTTNKVYGFDTFQGLPEDWDDHQAKGVYSQDGVLPKVNSNVELIVGLFQDTLQKFLDEARRYQIEKDFDMWQVYTIHFMKFWTSLTKRAFCIIFVTNKISFSVSAMPLT